ncbi:MAG: hypothetical protein OXH50_14025 [Gemmatimonadetes bacterium]|nr:hypothetical protein [Gemmatimonadota bacterium]
MKSRMHAIQGESSQLRRAGMRRWLQPLAAVLLLLLASSCGKEDPAQPVSETEAARVKAELEDRSFRQFEPSRDADRRKAVILDFFDGITIWAQYAEGNRAVSEWEVSARDYRIRQEGASVITIHLEEPGSRRQFPEECADCIPTSRFSISIRSVFDPERISFKLNDPGNDLPSPFPVFKSWTRFQEDEYFD